MNLLRSFLLLAVLFAVYASACQGSQPPRARVSGQQTGNKGKEDGNQGEMKEVEKEDPEKKAFDKFTKDKWIKANEADYMTAQDMKELAGKLMVPEDDLNKFADYAEKTNDRIWPIIRDVKAKNPQGRK